MLPLPAAAMLKNLHQRAASNFLMKNLLQNEATPATDFSLTFNLAASFVACQRETEAEYLRLGRDMMMLASGESGNIEQLRQGQHLQHQQQDIASSGRTSVESAVGGGQLDVNGGEAHAQQLTMIDQAIAGRNSVESREECSVAMDDRYHLKRSSSGEIYLDTKRLKRHNSMLVNRFDLVRPSIDRIDNRSNSAAESANSLDELDQTSGLDHEIGPPPDHEVSRSIASGQMDTKKSGCWIGNPISSRFADLGSVRVTGHIDVLVEEAHRQQQNGRLSRIQGMKSEDNRIGGEETCTCGDEQCPGMGECNSRRIQEKENPELKFSVRRILGDDYNRRPNPGNNQLSFYTFITRFYRLASQEPKSKGFPSFRSNPRNSI